MKLLRPLIASSILHAAATANIVAPQDGGVTGAEATDTAPTPYAPYSYDDDDYSTSAADDYSTSAAAAREDAYYLRLAQGMTAAVRDAREEIYKAPPESFDDFFDEYDYEGFEWYEDEEDLWTWSKYPDEPPPSIVERVYVERADDDDLVLPCLLAGAAVVMVGGLSIGFVLGLPYASQRRRPVPATLYRVASKDVDAAGLADLALAEVV